MLQAKIKLRINLGENKINLKSNLTRNIYAQGGYSGFQVMGMIEWSQKSRPQKIPRASSKTQKNPY